MFATSLASVRVVIWKYLSIKDQRAIRQLGQQFQWEINHIVGVHAILKGPKPWNEWTFTEKKRCLLSFANPETRRFKENLDWITNSAVRSLSLCRLGGISLEPSNLISNGHILERLVVQLDQNIAPKALIMEMLNKCNNLRTIEVYCQYPPKTFMFRPGDIESCLRYASEATSFTQCIRSSIVSKAHLKELIVRVDMLNIAKHFMGTPTEPTEEGQIAYPSAIEVLHIQFPIFNHIQGPLELTAWKDLLDRQTQLTELTVDLGFVYWTYFSNVVRNNGKTLRKLSLSLANWKRVRAAHNWYEVVPEAHQLDWTHLLPNPKNFTSLKVAMSTDMNHIIDPPHLTRNFVDLELDALETLELRSVDLDADDFNMIFLEIPNLKNVNLKYWSTLGLPEPELTEIARTTFVPLFRALLMSNVLENVVMKDFCIRRCPQYLRALMSDLPNYVCSWPYWGHYKRFRNVHLMRIDDLTITRKPENQIIEPILEEAE